MAGEKGKAPMRKETMGKRDRTSTAEEKAPLMDLEAPQKKIREFVPKECLEMQGNQLGGILEEFERNHRDMDEIHEEHRNGIQGFVERWKRTNRYMEDMHLYQFLKEVQECNSWFDGVVNKLGTQMPDKWTLSSMKYKDLEQKKKAASLLQTVKGILSEETINELCGLVMSPHEEDMLQEISQVLCTVGRYLSMATIKERAPPPCLRKSVDDIMTSAGMIGEDKL